MFFPYVPGSKLVVLGMVIPPLIGNPYNGYINPYYWVDDHPLSYGNNGSLDPGTYEIGVFPHGNRHPDIEIIFPPTKKCLVDFTLDQGWRLSNFGVFEFHGFCSKKIQKTRFWGVGLFEKTLIIDAILEGFNTSNNNGRHWSTDPNLVRRFVIFFEGFFGGFQTSPGVGFCPSNKNKLDSSLAIYKSMDMSDFLDLFSRSARARARAKKKCITLRFWESKGTPQCHPPKK